MNALKGSNSYRGLGTYPIGVAVKGSQGNTCEDPPGRSNWKSQLVSEESGKSWWSKDSVRGQLVKEQRLDRLGTQT